MNFGIEDSSEIVEYNGLPIYYGNAPELVKRAINLFINGMQHDKNLSHEDLNKLSMCSYLVLSMCICSFLYSYMRNSHELVSNSLFSLAASFGSLKYIKYIKEESEKNRI